MVLAVISTEAQTFVAEIFSSCHKWPIFPCGVCGNDKLLDVDFLEKTHLEDQEGG